MVTGKTTVQILYHIRGMPERLPILLLHLGRTGISLDGEELAVHFRGDRGDLGDHVPDALRGCQGGLRCRPIKIDEMRTRLVSFSISVNSYM